MRRITILSVGLIILSSCFLWAGSMDVTPQETFKMLQNPATYIVDVRTIAEYVFVGHPEMATNIPLLFWNENELKMEANENFIEDIKAKFKPEDTLILMCRSGGRSERAMGLLKASGFKSVFNMKYGFEGEKDPQGYRSVNGWKISGLPYTYSLSEDLLYKSK
jgi:rhodanese-related sulfurtransferase